MPDKKLYIGIDLGGTKIAVGLVSSRGKILHQVILPTEAKNGPKRVIEQIINSVKQLLKEAHKKPKDITAIGLGVPGEVIFKKGLMVSSPNLPGIQNLPLRKILAKEFKVQVFMDNDANVAVWGEYKFGAGQKSQGNLVFMTISTGIGGGLILDGKIYRGMHGVAGEIGHMTILPEGPPCSCGKFGCLEALASGTAIAQQAGAKNAAIVVQAARNQDRKAIKILNQAGTYIGIAAANVANLLDIETFIIGGGVSQAGNLLFTPMRQAAKKHALKTISAHLKIIPSTLKEKAGILGAVSLCLK